MFCEKIEPRWPPSKENAVVYHRWRLTLVGLLITGSFVAGFGRSMSSLALTILLDNTGRYSCKIKEWKSKRKTMVRKSETRTSTDKNDSAWSPFRRPGRFQTAVITTRWHLAIMPSKCHRRGLKLIDHRRLVYLLTHQLLVRSMFDLGSKMCVTLISVDRLVCRRLL